MKKVIITPAPPESSVPLSEVAEHMPIFAVEDGKLCGMVVHERGNGWIIKLGGLLGAAGHHPTRLKCMEASAQDFTFITDIAIVG